MFTNYLHGSHFFFKTMLCMGYDDIYMDEDYDDDRYYRDSEYADGVDDAIEDAKEEGRDVW